LYRRIVTHDDFDGVISAALCAYIYSIEQFYFTGPRSIGRAEVTIDERDIVCDLPYAGSCGLWFDHHAGNLEELRYRGIDPESIPGSFREEPSCARVVYEHHRASTELPGRFEIMVVEADRIDSFDYRDVADWRRETPGRIVDNAIKLRSLDRRERLNFLSWLTGILTTDSLETISGNERVLQRYHTMLEQEEVMFERIKMDASFIDEDRNKEIVIIDRTRHNRQDPIDKQLAFLAFPESDAILEIKNPFRGGRKSVDLALSMSLTMHCNQQEHCRDVGEIMRRLNIGDGHAGAGAGEFPCSSKTEMEQGKKHLLHTIYTIWKEMDNGHM